MNMKKHFILLSILLLIVNFAVFCDYYDDNYYYDDYYYGNYTVFNSEFFLSGYVNYSSKTKIASGYQTNYFSAQRLNSTVQLQQNTPEQFTFFVITNNYYSSMSFDISGEPLRNANGDELNYIAKQRYNYWTFNSGINPLENANFENTSNYQNNSIIYSTMFTIALEENSNPASGNYSGTITFTLREN